MAQMIEHEPTTYYGRLVVKQTLTLEESSTAELPDNVLLDVGGAIKQVDGTTESLDNLGDGATFRRVAGVTVGNLITESGSVENQIANKLAKLVGGACGEGEVGGMIGSDFLLPGTYAVSWDAGPPKELTVHDGAIFAAAGGSGYIQHNTDTCGPVPHAYFIYSGVAGNVITITSFVAPNGAYAPVAGDLCYPLTRMEGNMGNSGEIVQYSDDGVGAGGNIEWSLGLSPVGSDYDVLNIRVDTNKRRIVFEDLVGVELLVLEATTALAGSKFLVNDASGNQVAHLSNSGVDIGTGSTGKLTFGGSGSLGTDMNVDGTYEVDGIDISRLTDQIYNQYTEAKKAAGNAAASLDPWVETGTTYFTKIRVAGVMRQPFTKASVECWALTDDNTDIATFPKFSIRASNDNGSTWTAWADSADMDSLTYENLSSTVDISGFSADDKIQVEVRLRGGETTGIPTPTTGQIKDVVIFLHRDLLT